MCFSRSEGSLGKDRKEKRGRNHGQGGPAPGLSELQLSVPAGSPGSATGSGMRLGCAGRTSSSRTRGQERKEWKPPGPGFQAWLHF